jgi:hypothetical protein
VTVMGLLCVMGVGIPSVKADVPVLVLFKALGTVVSCYQRGLASNPKHPMFLLYA